jgi:hypothetical protein
VRGPGQEIFPELVSGIRIWMTGIIATVHHGRSGHGKKHRKQPILIQVGIAPGGDQGRIDYLHTQFRNGLEVELRIVRVALRIQQYEIEQFFIPA